MFFHGHGMTVCIRCFELLKSNVVFICACSMQDIDNMSRKKKKKIYFYNRGKGKAIKFYTYKNQ